MSMIDWQTQLELLSSAERHKIVEAVLDYANAHNITDAELARQCELSKGTISMARRNVEPTMRTTIELCQVFEEVHKTTVAWLLWHHGYKDVIGMRPKI